MQKPKAENETTIQTQFLSVCYWIYADFNYLSAENLFRLEGIPVHDASVMSIYFDEETLLAGPRCKMSQAQFGRSYIS